MSESDQRHIMRDSLFVLAGLRVDGRDPAYRVKIRNLSAGGLMAEGDLRVVRGTQVSVEIRNVGWVRGAVAWVQENRFGIAFDTQIDPKLARAASFPSPDADANFVPLRPLAALKAAPPSALRKV